MSPPHQLLETERDKLSLAAREQASTHGSRPADSPGKRRTATVGVPEPAAAKPEPRPGGGGAGCRRPDASDGSEPADAASLPRGATSFPGFEAETKQKSGQTQPATRRVSQRRRGTERPKLHVSEMGEMTSLRAVQMAQTARDSVLRGRRPAAPTRRTWVEDMDEQAEAETENTLYNSVENRKHLGTHPTKDGRYLLAENCKVFPRGVRNWNKRGETFLAGQKTQKRSDVCSPHGSPYPGSALLTAAPPPPRLQLRKG